MVGSPLLLNYQLPQPHPIVLNILSPPKLPPRYWIMLSAPPWGNTTWEPHQWPQCWHKFSVSQETNQVISNNSPEAITIIVFFIWNFLRTLLIINPIPYGISIPAMLQLKTHLGVIDSIFYTYIKITEPAQKVVGLINRTMSIVCCELSQGGFNDMFSRLFVKLQT